MEDKRKKIWKGRGWAGGQRRKRKDDPGNKNMKNLDMLSSRCLLDSHLKLLSRQADRDKCKKLSIICVHKVHKAVISERIPRDRGC